MLRCRKFLISIICLFIFASTISSYAEEEIEDLIDICTPIWCPFPTGIDYLEIVDSPCETHTSAELWAMNQIYH